MQTHNELTFREEGHVYTLNDQVIDGLTSTIAEAGLIRSGDPWFMHRGTIVHLVTQFYDEGTLDEESIDPQIKGYFESWKRFREDQRYTPAKIEYRTHHPILQVATTIDRLPGPVDLKSGSPEPWHILQVAFQWDCLKAHKMEDLIQTPMDVYLDADGGPPKIRFYRQSELREAFKVYCSMLHFLRWRKEKYGNSNRP